MNDLTPSPEPKSVSNERHGLQIEFDIHTNLSFFKVWKVHGPTCAFIKIYNTQKPYSAHWLSLCIFVALILSLRINFLFYFITSLLGS